MPRTMASREPWTLAEKDLLQYERALKPPTKHKIIADLINTLVDYERRTDQALRLELHKQGNSWHFANETVSGARRAEVEGEIALLRQPGRPQQVRVAPPRVRAAPAPKKAKVQKRTPAKSRVSPRGAPAKSNASQKQAPATPRASRTQAMQRSVAEAAEILVRAAQSPEPTPQPQPSGLTIKIPARRREMPAEAFQRLYMTFGGEEEAERAKREKAWIEGVRAEEAKEETARAATAIKEVAAPLPNVFYGPSITLAEDVRQNGGASGGMKPRYGYELPLTSRMIGGIMKRKAIENGLAVF